MPLSTIRKRSSAGRIKMVYSSTQTTLVNYYVGGSGVGAVSTSNRRALWKRASWRPTQNGKGSTRCQGLCEPPPFSSIYTTTLTSFLKACPSILGRPLSLDAITTALNGNCAKALKDYHTTVKIRYEDCARPASSVGGGIGCRNDTITCKRLPHGEWICN